jgi:hypothetical protein
MAAGSAKVVVSPMARPSAISFNILRMIYRSGFGQLFGEINIVRHGDSPNSDGNEVFQFIDQILTRRKAFP